MFQQIDGDGDAKMSYCSEYWMLLMSRRKISWMSQRADAICVEYMRAYAHFSLDFHNKIRYVICVMYYRNNDIQI